MVQSTACLFMNIIFFGLYLYDSYLFCHFDFEWDYSAVKRWLILYAEAQWDRKDEQVREATLSK